MLYFGSFPPSPQHTTTLLYSANTLFVCIGPQHSAAQHSTAYSIRFSGPLLTLCLELRQHCGHIRT